MHACIILGIVRWVPKPRTRGWVVQKPINTNLGFRCNVGVSGTWFQTVLWKQPKLKVRKKSGSALELSRTFTHILRSALCHKSYLTLHRFEIHSACENLELSRTALLCCRLAASRLREAARWQLKSVTEQTITRSPFNTEIYLNGDLL